MDSTWIDSATAPHNLYPQRINEGYHYEYLWWRSPRFNGFTAWGHQENRHIRFNHPAKKAILGQL